jgi:hypothetical protein
MRPQAWACPRGAEPRDAPPGGVCAGRPDDVTAPPTTRPAPRASCSQRAPQTFVGEHERAPRPFSAPGLEALGGSYPKAPARGLGRPARGEALARGAPIARGKPAGAPPARSSVLRGRGRRGRRRAGGRGGRGAPVAAGPRPGHAPPAGLAVANAKAGRVEAAVHALDLGGFRIGVDVGAADEGNPKAEGEGSRSRHDEDGSQKELRRRHAGDLEGDRAARGGPRFRSKRRGRRETLPCRRQFRGRLAPMPLM